LQGKGGNYLYIHCPFHTPDRNPSFAINKEKFYAIDYHDNRIYNLRDLAEALGFKLNVPEEEGEQKVKPCFSLTWLRIHPAIDVVGDMAYVGIILPCEVTDKKGKITLKELPALVGSDKSLLLCLKEELVKHSCS